MDSVTQILNYVLTVAFLFLLVALVAGYFRLKSRRRQYMLDHPEVASAVESLAERRIETKARREPGIRCQEVRE